jgi:pyrroline-5-carboxylate reductase
MSLIKKIAILGGGNIGLSIAKGLQNSDLFDPKNIFITRRRTDLISELKKNGFIVTSDNKEAVINSDIIIIAVQPQQLNELLSEISSDLNPEKHLIISVVSGASIKAIKNHIGKNIEVIRAMPNTAIAIKESMTCLSAESKTNGKLKIAEDIFNQVGKTLIIDEEDDSSTALCDAE